MINFKDINGYENIYRISTNGKLVSLKNGVLKQYKDKNGYKTVYLYQDGKRKFFQIHRLIAQAFIPNPENKPQVNHINGVKDDNRLENLEWATNSENQKHSYNVLGRIAPTYRKGKFGKDHNHSIAVNQYDLDGNFIKEWGGLREAGRGIGIAYVGIGKVCKGEQKTSGGYIWKYK